MADVRCTYRLQLGPEQDFDDARLLVPYLRDLGVSHFYLSPVMEARPGSTHGYDVVDPTRVADALGGAAGLLDLAAAGLGLIVDFVPNHMAAVEENRFWRDHREQFFDVDPITGRHRRFFDIDELAGVRVEDPEVFAATHRTILALVREGVIDGLRIDHVDGLADPAGYLQRLRAAGVTQVWIEKILEPDEQLREWPIEGTTGYEFLGDVMGLFVDPEARSVLSAAAGERETFAEVAYAAKLEQVHTTFAPEVDRLRRIDDVPGLETGIAALPVYRTYVVPGRGEVDPLDREAVRALARPLARRLVLDDPVSPEFVTRFQQTSGAVMAKGVEDTACYRHLVLLALNEVGSDPGRFGLNVARFHAANEARLAETPTSLLAGQTHDTKRSLDVRSRLVALTWLPHEWATTVGEWRGRDTPREPHGPDADEETFLYQTLVGVWPIAPVRLDAYLRKALREAKRRTSWSEPDEEHEDAVIRFARATTTDPDFLRTFEPFVERVASLGERISLGQVVLRFTVPGVPDIYQGDELWDLSLVDPDNRRPVDWELRRQALADIRAGTPPTRETVKLFVMERLLALRRRRPQVFMSAYAPVAASRSTTCAFMRGDDVVVAVATRDGPVGEIERLGPEWTNVLAPLAALYEHPPLVYERVRS